MIILINGELHSSNDKSIGINLNPSEIDKIKSWTENNTLCSYSPDKNEKENKDFENFFLKELKSHSNTMSSRNNILEQENKNLRLQMEDFSRSKVKSQTYTDLKMLNPNNGNSEVDKQDGKDTKQDKKNITK